MGLPLHSQGLCAADGFSLVDLTEKISCFPSQFASVYFSQSLLPLLPLRCLAIGSGRQLQQPLMPGQRPRFEGIQCIIQRIVLIHEPSITPISPGGY